MVLLNISPKEWAGSVEGTNVLYLCRLLPNTVLPIKKKHLRISVKEMVLGSNDRIIFGNSQLI